MKYYKYILAALIGAGLFSAERYWENVFYHYMTARDRSDSVEKVCVELGISARRGLKNDRDTELFETLGCCYNDGKPEPKGC